MIFFVGQLHYVMTVFAFMLMPGVSWDMDDDDESTYSGYAEIPC